MSRYKLYPKYKESGTEWLGEVPDGWNIVRNKQVFKFIKNSVGENSSDYLLLSLTLNGIIPRDIESGKGKFPAEFNTYQEVYKNDLIFCLFDIDETPRTIGLSEYFGMITGAYNVARCNQGIDSKYVYYYYLSVDEYKGLKPFYTGLRKVVRTETFLNIELALPSLKEQKAIANFLDNATCKINTLIQKQQNLIELLKEKRQALISHAVTKGLNPHVKMKDSGVEWLGEVPEHWEVSKIGFLSNKIGSGKTPKGGSEVYSDEGIIFIRSQNVYDEGLRLEDVVFISKEIDEEMSNTRVRPGDILLNVTGASIGRTTLVPYNFDVANVNQHVCIIRINSIEMRPYISLVMKSTTVKIQIDAFQNGAAREGLNFEQIANIQIALPSISEQIAITNYLDNSTCKIDTLMAKAEKAIELLKEQRIALISATVTGKIDVREIA